MGFLYELLGKCHPAPVACYFLTYQLHWKRQLSLDFVLIKFFWWAARKKGMNFPPPSSAGKKNQPKICRANFVFFFIFFIHLSFNCSTVFLAPFFSLCYLKRSTCYWFVHLVKLVLPIRLSHDQFMVELHYKFLLMLRFIFAPAKN